MTTPHVELVDDAVSGPWLGAAGVLAMLVAVLGTVLLAPQDAIDPPSSDTCQMDVSRSARWTGQDCTDAGTLTDRPVVVSVR